MQLFCLIIRPKHLLFLLFLLFPLHNTYYLYYLLHITQHRSISSEEQPIPGLTRNVNVINSSTIPASPPTSPATSAASAEVVNPAKSSISLTGTFSGGMFVSYVYNFYIAVSILSRNTAFEQSALVQMVSLWSPIAIFVDYFSIMTTSSSFRFYSC